MLGIIQDYLHERGVKDVYLAASTGSHYNIEANIMLYVNRHFIRQIDATTIMIDNRDKINMYHPSSLRDIYDRITR